ncbi:MAG: hypothetical protein ABI863_22935 [Ginsengibacter sp.]
MKKLLLIFTFSILFLAAYVGPCKAQCSICSKTVQQMGDKPARGFNSGIIYLMLVPYALIGVIGYKWWKGNR